MGPAGHVPSYSSADAETTGPSLIQTFPPSTSSSTMLARRSPCPPCQHPRFVFLHLTGRVLPPRRSAKRQQHQDRIGLRKPSVGMAYESKLTAWPQKTTGRCTPSPSTEFFLSNRAHVTGALASRPPSHETPVNHERQDILTPIT